MRWHPVLLTSLVVVMGLCLPAMATEDDMVEQLPPQVDNCLACHVEGMSGLNPFGEDFLENGRIWDAVLADLDSDGDGCVNGVELGDANGDGENDSGVGDLSNPGVAGDCEPATVDRRTWGDLKALFDSK